MRYQRTAQGRYLLALAIVVLCSVAIGVLYCETRTVDTDAHQRFITALRRLQAVDAVLNQYLLQARSGDLPSLDPINTVLRSIRHIHDTLATPPRFLHPSGRDAILQSIAAHRALVARREQLVERFKAENANLQTSLTYFPVLAREQLERVEEVAAKPDLITPERREQLAGALEGVLRDVLLYNLTPTSDLEPSLREHLSTLKNLVEAHPNVIGPVDFTNFIEQVDTILRVKPAVDALLGELLAMPTMAHMDQIAQNYERFYQYALRKASFPRLWIGLAVVALLLALAWLIIEHLRDRIHDATAQLQHSNEQLEQQLQQMAALNAVSTAVSSVMEVDRVLDLIMEKTRDVMHAEANSLLLLDEAAGKLRFHVAKGEVADALSAATVDLGQGIVGYVAQSGETLLVKDAYRDPRFDPSYDKHSGFKTRSMITVPLTAKSGRVIGVIQAINKYGMGAFDDCDKRLFESFAAEASVALENARLYTETRQMAQDLRVALERERRLAIEKEKMGAYISKHVVDEISRNREAKLALGGHTVRTTIMFADIKGFTRLSETLDPHEIVSFLNIYMTAMTTIIENHHGVIDKFIGDGIMAIFTDQGHSHHALNAVRAGVKMQRELEQLRRGWKETRPNLSGLSIRIGINTGEVVAGNVGSETRMDYTLIGDNVNVAARIECACEPGMVYVSAATYEDLGERVVAAKMNPISVKNRQQPVYMYAIDPATA